ncbi:nucleoside hydrolase [Variovorax ginsengisoli]|uniref:Purine nucleosidase n=1 Tax=Variovorax ginsengisoli TaxID=363844 RepID=A0ABT9S3Z1_9BURK|nr:nucleoside hydrolase [Variovorax ginsengisoli]MDP9899064.1 purine nucleosidase [Variovorax ginsengisoli]
MHRLIIDTDPGQDDALALLVALGAPDIELLGVTTVAGNVPVTQTADNARRILELAGRGDVPVFAGASRPLLRAPRPVPEIHGETGIDGWDWLPAQRPPEAMHAVDWLVETLLREPAGSVSLIALAPQTNLALALRRAPQIAERLARVVFMGGGYFEGGNMTPAAEYNILVDPEAAAIVLGAGLDLTAVPLDCTHSAPAPIDWSVELDALGTSVGSACGGMVRFFEQYGNRKYGTRSRPLHDAVAIGAFLWPELFDGRLCPVDVECAGRLTTGMTVVDWLRQTGAPDNCHWVRTCLDPAQLYARMLGCLARLP